MITYRTFRILTGNGWIRYITCPISHYMWHMRCIGFAEINSRQTRHPDFVDMVDNLRWGDIR